MLYEKYDFIFSSYTRQEAQSILILPDYYYEYGIKPYGLFLTPNVALT